MKKKVTFEKKIEFPTMIGEVCAISLEHNLKFIDESNVEGDLLLNGKYKLTEASRLEEDFHYKIPTEIVLSERIDLNTSNIEIADFYYEIENDDVMICHIELLIEGLEIVDDILEEKEELEEVRECDGDSIVEKEIEIPVLDKKKEEEESFQEEKVDVEKILNKKDNNMSNDNNKINNDSLKVDVEEEVEKNNNDENNSKEETSLFFNFDDENDTYGTFIVYIVRQNETINSILSKYNTTLEEIEKYNDLKDINIGTKLIIPLLND